MPNISTRERRALLIDNSQKQKIRNNTSNQENKLEKLLHTSSRIVYSFKTFFPFDLFPDTIIISESGITIHEHEFFFSDSVHTILVDRISSINVSYALFFAELTIIPQGINPTPFVIKNLLTKNAEQAQKIVLGLLVAKKNDIDTSAIPLPKLSSTLESLGEQISKNVKST